MGIKTVYLIDGSSFLYRFFFAIKNLSRNGHPTGAVFGFARMLLDIDKSSPEYMSVMFDTKAKTFRNDLFKDYKQNRPKMPDDLLLQIEPIKKLIKYFGIEIIEKDGFEADDLIATFADKLKKEFKVVVIANDKDLFQFVEDERVVIYDPVKKMFYNEYEVYKKLGVYPNQVADYLALIGDNIDNIPGIRSIGPKTASDLLKNYKTCENIVGNLDKLKPKIKDAIENDGNLMLYKNLTTVDRNVPIEIDMESLKIKEKQFDKIEEMFSQFGFRSLVKNLNTEDKTEDKMEINIEQTDTPIIYVDNGRVYIFKNNEIKEIKPDAVPYESAVYDLKGLLWKGFKFNKQPFDIKLASYLVDSESNGKIDKCFDGVNDELQHKINSVPEFYKKLTLALNELRTMIIEQNMKSLLNDIEIPLSFVLYKMEKVGLKIDTEFLYKFKNELLNKQEILTREIYSLSNEEFNINSTKELQRILFNKLKIKPIRKTKTGYSTDSETLAELSKKYEIADLIIKYREISKVISTYIIPFIEKTDKNSRLHTTFNQTLTSTGRLSSSNPNLQNLPAGDDDIHSGIRRSVIVRNGYKLICSDYSQIELRVLAHLSMDETLIGIFKNGDDIHTQTAVKLFGVHPSMVDHNLRRTAKIINFGILYGMGYVSLSKTLNIQRSKAKDIIDKYFDRFRGVKSFIDDTIEYALQKGYVETYFKRRRYFHNIDSSNQRLAGFEKRAAVNAVIQGSAADIIKIAMIELDKKLSSINAAIVMQVHDELLIEADSAIAEDVKNIVKNTMENVVKFDIPLSVNIKIADNWLEAK